MISGSVENRKWELKVFPKNVKKYLHNIHSGCIIMRILFI